MQLENTFKTNEVLHIFDFRWKLHFSQNLSQSNAPRAPWIDEKSVLVPPKPSAWRNFALFFHFPSPRNPKSTVQTPEFTVQTPKFKKYFQIFASIHFFPSLPTRQFFFLKITSINFCPSLPSIHFCPSLRTRRCP